MTTGAHLQEVAAADGRGERRGVMLAAAVLLLAWAAGVGLRPWRPAGTELAAHQVSAFDVLTPLEQGLFNDLRAAADEIRVRQRQEQAWPEPAALAAEAIPPFTPDAAWAQRGRLAWRRLDAHAPTHAVYWGRNPASEWALVLTVDAAAVWRRTPREDSAIPQAIPEMLVLDGWQELVPRAAISAP